MVKMCSQFNMKDILYISKTGVAKSYTTLLNISFFSNSDHWYCQKDGIWLGLKKCLSMDHKDEFWLALENACQFLTKIVSDWLWKMPANSSQRWFLIGSGKCLPTPHKVDFWLALKKCLPTLHKDAIKKLSTKMAADC